MSYPGPLTPEPFSTQNLKDDDGAVIDSFFVETDSPPDLKPAVEPVPAPAIQEPKRNTRILTRSILLNPANAGITDPIQLFPADASRKGVGIRVVSPTAVVTDGIRIASDPGEIYTAGRIFHGQDIANGALYDHVGPIYILGCGATATGIPSANVTVEAWAVTI
jgi:hypothetical protein